MEGKYFNGKKYYYNGFFDNKREATAKASQLRKKGYLARIVSVSRGYEVWDRRK